MAKPLQEPGPDPRALRDRALTLALDIAAAAEPEELAKLEEKIAAALKLQWARGYTAASHRLSRKAERQTKRSG
jgi:hypothetical protein